MRRFFSFKLILAVALSGINAHALYTFPDYVTAFRVPSKSIVVDGKPETIWKAVAGIQGGVSTISFNDYKKIVLLEADNIRNADPALYYKAPSQGSVNMLAVYDDSAFYLLFLVKENNGYNPKNLCSAANLWKANAAEVFIDPSPWSTTLYTSYFSKDMSGLVYGTSPKTIQFDKPIYPKDTSLYYRDRTKNDRFQNPATTPKGVTAVSTSRTTADSLTDIVEMKIPFWGGTPSAFAAGKSMFISWGYNHNIDSAGDKCSANPIAYRWAKHYKTYLSSDPQKPPGWVANDSTHYDPLRSWDGWGQLFLSSEQPNVNYCRAGMDATVWDVTYWGSSCSNVSTGIRPIDASQRTSGVTLPGRYPVAGSLWDVRGRMLKVNPMSPDAKEATRK